MKCNSLALLTSFLLLHACGEYSDRSNTNKAANQASSVNGHLPKANVETNGSTEDCRVGQGMSSTGLCQVTAGIIVRQVQQPSKGSSSETKQEPKASPSTSPTGEGQSPTVSKCEPNIDEDGQETLAGVSERCRIEIRRQWNENQVVLVKAEEYPFTLRAYRVRFETERCDNLCVAQKLLSDLGEIPTPHSLEQKIDYSTRDGRFESADMITECRAVDPSSSARCQIVRQYRQGRQNGIWIDIEISGNATEQPRTSASNEASVRDTILENSVLKETRMNLLAHNALECWARYGSRAVKGELLLFKAGRVKNVRSMWLRFAGSNEDEITCYHTLL